MAVVETKFPKASARDSLLVRPVAIGLTKGGDHAWIDTFEIIDLACAHLVVTAAFARRANEARLATAAEDDAAAYVGASKTDVQNDLAHTMATLGAA